MIDPPTRLLRVVGESLYGPSWQTPLAEALDLNVRTVQRWARSERQPSLDTWLRLAALVRHRRADLEDILDAIAAERQRRIKR